MGSDYPILEFDGEKRLSLSPQKSSSRSTFPIELCVEHNGEVYLMELRRNKADVERRTAVFLKDFGAHGWTAIPETSS